MNRFFVLLALAGVSCRTMRQEDQLINLASVNGKYSVMIVYHNKERHVVGVQRRGKDNIRFDGFGDSFLTYWYQFDGVRWKPCEAPPEKVEEMRKRMEKGVTP